MMVTATTPRPSSPLSGAEEIVSAQRRGFKDSPVSQKNTREFFAVAELVLSVATGSQRHSATSTELLAGMLAIADANGCGPGARDIAAMVREPVHAAAAVAIVVASHVLAYGERLRFAESGPGSLAGLSGNGWLTYVRDMGERRIANLPPEQAVFVALRDELLARGAARGWSNDEFVGIQKLSRSLLTSVLWGHTAQVI